MRLRRTTAAATTTMITMAAATTTYIVIGASLVGWGAWVGICEADGVFIGDGVGTMFEVGVGKGAGDCVVVAAGVGVVATSKWVVPVEE